MFQFCATVNLAVLNDQNITFLGSSLQLFNAFTNTLYGFRLVSATSVFVLDEIKSEKREKLGQP